MTMNEKQLRELREKTFRKTPGINPRLVEQHERLEKELAKLGVKIKPEYGLEPPLGWKRANYERQTDIDNSPGKLPHPIPECVPEPPLGWRRRSFGKRTEMENSPGRFRRVPLRSPNV